MARIIPWKLPDVQGGSVGGYTPAPTPEPLTNYPYDLDNLVLSTEFKGQSYKSMGTSSTYGGVYGLVNISGVKILDSSEVTSVIATVELTAGDVTFTGADSTTKDLTLSDAEFQIEIATLMHSEGGTAEIAGSDYGGMKLFGSDQTYYVKVGSMAAYPCTLTSTTCTLTVTKLVVYNGNGVALQEWEAE